MVITTTINSPHCPTAGPKENPPTLGELKNNYDSYGGMAAAEMPLAESKRYQLAAMINGNGPQSVYGVSDEGKYAVANPPEAQLQIHPLEPRSHHSAMSHLDQQNPNNLHTERFKIDRQKLKQMMKARSAIEGMNGAEYFFDNLMKTTETVIIWPSQLNIEGKNRKDPHVRITGEADAVRRAKERILANLDTGGSRVIMKMDVSHSDHSHIIGRGGNNIRRIAQDTSTYIHFSESYRPSPTEKSNQVSVCGSLGGVEKARALVRLSTLLLVSFELPVVAPAGCPQPHKESAFVIFVQQKYNIQVNFFPRYKLDTFLVLLKGTQKEAKNVQEAAQNLIHFYCGNTLNQILIKMQLEISPHHQAIVKGKNNANLLSIMQQTNTKITFPELSDMNYVKSRKMGLVTITGSMEGVYKARQQLLGALPIAIIFDYHGAENIFREIKSLNTKYGVHITSRRKRNQTTLAIIIKGVEKFVDKIYQARHEILCLTTPIVKPEIPVSYLMPNDNDFNLVYRVTLTNLLASYTETPKIYTTLPSRHLRNAPAADVCSPSLRYRRYLKSIAARRQQQPQLNPNNNFINVQPRLHFTQQQQSSASGSYKLWRRNTYSNHTSGYQSFSSGNSSRTTSLQQAYQPYGGATKNTNARVPSILANIRLSPYLTDSNYTNEAASSSRCGKRSSDSVLLGSNAAASTGYLPPTPFESYQNMHHNNLNHSHNFDKGFKATERNGGDEMRAATPNFMLAGLTHTPLAPFGTTPPWERSLGGVGYLASPYGLGITTGNIDASTSVGLENYTKMFLLDEIDWNLLTTVSAEDFIEMGIAAFEARNKVLTAIHAVHANDAASSNTSFKRYSGSKAPGAERRCSSRW